MATAKDAPLLVDMTRNLLLSGRLWRKIARQTAATHGVSEAASAPLIWIDRLGENVRQNVLAEAVGIEGASLVRLLDELQASGLVTRTPDPADRRANGLNLTEQGKVVVAEMTADLIALRVKVFASVPVEDLEATMRVFQALIDAAESPT